MAENEGVQSVTVKRGWLWLPGIILVALVVLFVVLVVRGRGSEEQKNFLRFAALGNQMITAPAIIAVKENRFQNEHIQVRSFDVNAGAVAKDAVVNGNADVAIVANAPLVIAASKGEDVIILGSVMFSDRLHAVVSRPSSNPIPGDVGYVPGTSSEFFLRKVIAAEHLSPDLLSHAVKLRPPGVQPAFTARSIQSGVIWEPFVSEMSRSKTSPFETLPNVRVNKYPGLYAFRFYLITSRSAWRAKRNSILAFVSTLRTVCGEIKAAPDDARERIEAIFGYRKGWLAPIWGDLDFSFTSDEAAMRQPLDADAQLAMDSGLISTRPDLDPLFEVIRQARAKTGP
jgi:ABC-type nitrate/sulfonate/bicarbonate transport system substrate-binding protein